MEKDIKKEALRQYFKYFKIWFIIAGILAVITIGAAVVHALTPKTVRDNSQEPAYEEPAYEEPAYEEPAYEEPSYDSGSSSSIVSVAQNYLGVPYVWGGTSPSGFDCSGFTQYVFRQCGYSINRTADAQYSNGSYVSYDSLQAGDLVFFANTYSASGITHVGIYIGGGQFIHAANGGVKISSLSESYYSSRYYGARRIA